MPEKIRIIIKKNWDIISYLFFGGLTTLVNFIVYFPLYNWAHCSALVSNSIAWVFAVIFAFLTNKPFVFKSYDWSRNTVLRELSAFVACRIGSGLLETLIMFVSVDLLMGNGNIMKIFVSVLVIILNYIGSKFLVFRKKDA